jgi:hypothetical protein
MSVAGDAGRDVMVRITELGATAATLVASLGREG